MGTFPLDVLEAIDWLSTSTPLDSDCYPWVAYVILRFKVFVGTILLPLIGVCYMLESFTELLLTLFEGESAS